MCDLISSRAINIYRNRIEQGRLPMTIQHFFRRVQAVIACWYCNPHEEIIPLFQYILKKLNDYNLAFVQITGPAQDFKGTPAEILQNEYFSHFRYHDNGRLMANLGFTRRTGNAILEEGKAGLVSLDNDLLPA